MGNIYKGTGANISWTSVATGRSETALTCSKVGPHGDSSKICLLLGTESTDTADNRGAPRQATLKSTAADPTSIE